MISVSAVLVAAAVLLASVFAYIAHKSNQNEFAAKLVSETAKAEAADAKLDATVEEAQRLMSGMTPDFARAVELLTQVIEKRPNDAKLYLFRGGAKQELGQLTEAIVDLEHSLELQQNDNPSPHWLIAIAARQLGQEEKVRQHEQLARASDVGSIESLVVQALAFPYHERGIELLDEAISRNPFDPKLYFQRGRIAYNLLSRKCYHRYYVRAVEDLERALVARPGDEQILTLLCFCLERFGPYFASPGERPLDRSKQLLDQWLQRSPNDPNAVSLLGTWHWFREHKHGDALRFLQKNAELKNIPSAHALLAHLYWQMDRDQDAMKSVTTCFELMQQQSRVGASGLRSWQMGLADIYCLRSKIHVSLGNELQGERDLAKAWTLQPKTNWNFYDWVHMHLANVRLNNLEGALEVADEWIKVAPECSRAHVHRAIVFGLRQEFSRQLNDCTRAIDLGDFSARAGRVATYINMGRYDDALLDARRAMSLLQTNPKGSRISDKEQVNHRNVEFFAELAWALLSYPTEDRRIGEAGLELCGKADNWTELWNLRGLAYLRLGRWQQAIEATGESLAYFPGRFEASKKLCLAMANWRLGNRQAALSWHEEADTWTNNHNFRRTSRLRTEAEKLMGIDQDRAWPPSTTKIRSPDQQR